MIVVKVFIEFIFLCRIVSVLVCFLDRWRFFEIVLLFKLVSWCSVFGVSFIFFFKCIKGVSVWLLVLGRICFKILVCCMVVIEVVGFVVDNSFKIFVLMCFFEICLRFLKVLVIVVKVFGFMFVIGFLYYE